ncbi:unnamed protein product [marine sediment metagenome]|uniref:Uncharacterized protein n=1 Tax=marine sediment metagenome TaxID=412755 RepID=X1A1G1_9ZZZZ
MSEKYNGWTNYETWAVNLWFTNKQKIYDYINKEIDRAKKEITADDICTKKENITHYVADTLKEDIENEMDYQGLYNKSVFTDLINAGLSAVNWYEIACGFMEDYKDDE